MDRCIELGFLFDFQGGIGNKTSVRDCSTVSFSLFTPSPTDKFDVLSIACAFSWRHHSTSRKFVASSPDKSWFCFTVDLILPAALWPWDLPNLKQEWVPARKADNYAAICEPIV
jgi:hypothetical protein